MDEPKFFVIGKNSEDGNYFIVSKLTESLPEAHLWERKAKQTKAYYDLQICQTLYG